MPGRRASDKRIPHLRFKNRTIAPAAPARPRAAEPPGLSRVPRARALERPRARLPHVGRCARAAAGGCVRTEVRVHHFARLEAEETVRLRRARA